MKVWVTVFELNETMVGLHYDAPRQAASGWYESRDMGAMSRDIARRLFGRLPRHGSADEKADYAAMASARTSRVQTVLGW